MKKAVCSENTEPDLCPEAINARFNDELLLQIAGALPMNWFKSGDKLIAWIDKRKALHYVSSQSSTNIAGGNTESFLNSIKDIIKNFKNPELPINKIAYSPDKVNTQNKIFSTSSPEEKFGGILEEARYASHSLPAPNFHTYNISKLFNAVNTQNIFFSTPNQKEIL